MQKVQGFTLIELMIVVVILSILTMIALPSYNAYTRRADETRAEEYMQNLAMQLDRHKARQFNYLGFATGATAVTLPIGATGASIKYSVTVKDGAAGNPLLTDATAAGLIWVIKAEATDSRLNSYLLTSNGVRCKNKAKANITYSDCSSGGEAW